MDQMSTEKKKLHLGCGNSWLPGYINVDIIRGDSVHCVADLRSLPYETASVDLIYSCAAIEHFGRPANGFQY